MLGSMPFLQLGIPLSFFKFTLSDFFLFTFSLFILTRLRLERNYIPFLVGACLFFIGTSLSIVKAINISNYIFSHLPWIYAVLLIISTGYVFREYKFEKLAYVKKILLYILIFSLIPVYLEFFGGFFFSAMHFKGHRYMFFMLNPNQYMAFVIVVLFFLTLYYTKYEKKYQSGLIFLVIACILPILASGSRTGLVGVLGVLMINLSIFFLRIRLAGKVVTISTLFFIIPVFLAIIESVSQSNWLFARAFSIFRLFSGEDKVEDIAADSGHSIEYGFELFQKNPFFGIGLGNFIEYNNHEVHNTFVSILAETGLIGFSLFIVFWIIFIGTILYSRNTILYKYSSLVIVMLYLAMNIPHILIRERWIWMFFSLMIIITTTHVRNNRKRKLVI